ncbi:MAG TPA: hypothetical protein VFF98_17320 [Novosphingobium sp.]|nr:hypothetical protein [Novosphingobium sp.]
MPGWLSTLSRLLLTPPVIAAVLTIWVLINVAITLWACWCLRPRKHLSRHQPPRAPSISREGTHDAH